MTDKRRLLLHNERVLTVTKMSSKSDSNKCNDLLVILINMRKYLRNQSFVVFYIDAVSFKTVIHRV